MTRVNTVKCCLQREITAGNLGSEDRKNRRFLWPGPFKLTHRKLYEGENGVTQIHVTKVGQSTAAKRKGSAGTMIGALYDGSPAAIYLYSVKRRWADGTGQGRSISR